MRPRSVIGVAVAALVVASVVFYALQNRERRREEVIGRETDAKAAALKADIDANVRTGATEVDVIRFLHTRGWSYAPDPQADSALFLRVGERPSGVWYCGPVTVGVLLTLRNRRLVEASVTSRALDCL